MIKKLKFHRDYRLIRRSGLFDDNYYLLNNPDVRRADVNPLMHFVKFGWREGRNPSEYFDTNYYLQTNADVQKEGINPLIHYVRTGASEKRICLPESVVSQGIGGESVVNVDQAWKTESTPKFFIFNGTNEVVLKKNHDTAVILHVYYSELLAEIATQLKNLEGNFDIYVSIPKSKPEFSKLVFSYFPEAKLILVENRGRDIAPFLEIFKAIRQLNYCYILKLHTKKSPHRVDGEFWRKDIFDKLIGSKETIRLIKNSLINDTQIGMIGPQGHVLDSMIYLGGNETHIKDLATRAGFFSWQSASFLFVAGSMFWVKPDAIQVLADLNINSNDFEPEPIDSDGAFVHGMERFFGLVIQEAGYSLCEVDEHGLICQAIPNNSYRFAPLVEEKNVGKITGRKTIVYFSAYKENFAIEYLRILAPLRQAGFEIIDGVVDGDIVVDRVLLGDAVFFQREFPVNLNAYNQIICLAKQSKKPIVYDLDDLLFALPERHPEMCENVYFSALLPMLLAVVEADFVTVSTKRLQEMLVGFNNNVIVLPNYLDDNIWSLRPPSLHNVNKHITIGYMGSSSHKPDLEIVTAILLELLKKYSNRIRIHFWGTEPPEQLKIHPEVQWTPSLSNNYINFVREFQEQSADIFIAPLAVNEFNNCKSPLKFFEYSALGAPGVYSRLSPYTQVITHGYDGFLASSQEEWLGYLEQLIEDENLRKTIAENAQNTIRSKWLLSKNKDKLRKTYELITIPDNLELSKKNKMSFLIRSISQQLFQNEKLLRNEVLLADNQVRSLNDELNARNDELREIRISKSWKLAMLFRRISVCIKQLLTIPINLKDEIVNWFTKIILKLKHWKAFNKYSKLIRKSNLFDRDWYLRTYPDVANAKIDPLKHYIKYGGFEKRDPSPSFSSEWYLDTNPDVKMSGMNPLIHYLLFGQYESRLPKAQATQNSGFVDVNSVDPLSIMTSGELEQTIKKRIKFDRYIVSLSHDSYLKVTTGGVQVFISDEQKSCNLNAVSYLHLYPYKFSQFLLMESTSQLIGMNLDGEYLGVCEIDSLIGALHQIHSIKLEDIHIHHTMGFNINAIKKILELGNNNAEFWLHDYFTICPSYHLLRNDLEYCGAPNINSNACTICKYSEMRRQQAPAFLELFDKNNLRIIAPSNFTLNFWKKKVSYRFTSVDVVPLIKLNRLNNLPINRSKRLIRIGYLGYPLEQKGWKTWAKLVENFDKDDRYGFFHFSSVVGPPGNYQRIYTEVSPDNRNSMIDNLNLYEIDVAILWSQVPETFSFTLHEALAAGCLIITSNKSGNIQDFISQNPQYGVVLNDEKELFTLFSGNELSLMVKKYQKKGKPQMSFLAQSFRSRE